MEIVLTLVATTLPARRRPAHIAALSAGYLRHFLKPLDISLFVDALEELVAEFGNH